jgi:DNA repair photolyase
MKKSYFRYSANTGIAPSKAFEKKLLAKYSVNIGNVCQFGCAYCYVPDLPFPHPSVKMLAEQGHARDCISNYREYDNLIDTVTRDLKKFSAEDTSTVFFCTTCDPCATPEHVNMTSAAAMLILSKSNLQIRILSKSSNITEVAKNLSDYKDRVSYGLSTGTCLDEISRSIETNASPIKERVAALHWLQDNGYRTYGMICPVLPSEKGRVKDLLDQIRPEFCEDIWVEAINDKGTSLTNTKAALMKSGLDWPSSAMTSIMISKTAWRQHAKELFLAFQREFKKRKMLNKFHYLQYVTKADKEFFSGQPGAVCL